MSHSKRRSRAKSFWIDRDPAVLKHLVSCVACGRKGVTPEFAAQSHGDIAKSDLINLHPPLSLNAVGACDVCASARGSI